MQTTTITNGATAVTVSRLCFGIMNFGSGVDDTTAFALLDRFREAGGTFVDTANNYNSWAEGGHGRESEDVLGRWLASRHAGAEMVVATKVGAGKADPDLPLSGTEPTNFEGLDRALVRRELTTSLQHLGLDQVGVYYGHVDDRSLKAEVIAETFAELAEEGLIVVPGMSNTATWRLTRMRDWAASNRRPAVGAWQQQGTVLWPRPGFAENAVVTPEGIDYAGTVGDLAILPYGPQQAGLFARPWMPLRETYDHPGSHERIRVLHQIAHELGATANQVVLALLMSHDPETIPIFGASRMDQLEETLGAADLVVPEELRARLDVL